VTATPPPGWTLRRWTSFTISIAVPPCHMQQTFTTSKLGGAPALVYEVKCAEGLVFQLAAVHSQRGYLFISAADAVDRRGFSMALRSFHFLGEARTGRSLSHAAPCGELGLCFGNRPSSVDLVDS
jgi:hypothetical protein